MTQRTRHLVDLEILPLLDSLPALSLSDETLATMRANEFKLPVDPEVEAQVGVERLSAPGPLGAPDVGLVCYRPKALDGALPGVLHIHGGGYVGGTVEMMAWANAAFALELGCAVVSVDYRLAPETRAPGAVEDCYAALAWLKRHPDIAGLDPARIGVMGESAGGGLAAALALLARDRGEHRLAFQHLVYPMLDDRTAGQGEDARHPNVGEFVWTADSNRYGWTSLLGHEPGRDGVSPYAAPARAENLAGLPPTFLYTGALDLFLEENIAYARRLIRAGVPTEFHIYPGAVHGFELTGGELAARARRDAIEALRRDLSRPVR